jgi:Zn-dependent metalloprotease
MRNILSSFSIFFFCFGTLIAQPSLSRMQLKLQQQGANAETGIDFKMISPSQAGILFHSNGSLPETQARQWLEEQLEIRPDADLFRLDDNIANTTGIEVKKLHQYYRGIKVEHGVINITAKSGRIAMMQLEFYSVPDSFNTRAAITENAALQKALAFTGADVYEWAAAADAPHAELVIIKDYERDNEICLAYKFEIVALQPASAAYVYVNARDGRIVLNNPQIKHLSSTGNPLLQNQVAGDQTRSQKMMTAPNTGQELQTKKIISPFIPGANQAQASNYANIQGSAATKYNGIQFIYTDNGSNVAGKPFRLRSTRNGVDIETYNFNKGNHNSTIDFYAAATDFVDNDNNWTAAEFNNSNWDDAALNVQFSMQIVSDYWWLVHGRRGWDNGNSAIKSYVHVYELKKVSDGPPPLYQSFFMKNAFWWRKKMSFGDGNNTSASLPYTPLDISAHEMGHAITETTCDLVYQWESGALNEAFSDIWAACITDYAKHIYPVSDENVWRVAEKCENVGAQNPGFREMSNPGLFGDPSAYKNFNWKPASLQTCRDFENQDNCGVHSNSGVLNKWFFLITQGQAGTNSFGTPFNVEGLGFPVSEKIAYLTTLNLTPNASYQTCRTVSLNATASLYGINSPEYQSVKDAWVAVAVDSNIYRMSNTPVFTTDNFTSIAVGKDGVILAGTNYGGLYKYAANNWQKLPELTDVRFNDIKADHQGNFWIAQSGRSGTQGGGSSITGGVNYYQHPFTANSTLYTVGAATDVPSRNARCIYVDTFRTNDGGNPKVWMAGLAYITSFNSTSGMLGQGLFNATPKFKPVNGNINIGSGTVGCLTVGGSKTKIWTFVQANNGVNQLLTYDAVTNAFIESFDHTSHPVIPSGFVARSVYCDAKGRTWAGLANGGIIVYDENNVWHHVNFPAIFPAGTQASFNAITGTPEGDVYIGTTNGMVFFERGDGLVDKIDQQGSYKAFGKPNGLPSNVVNAIAYDSLRFKLLLATDSGLVFWEPLCITPYCKEYQFNAAADAETIAAGNWSNPAIWNTGKLPDSATNVLIKHNVTVDINGKCNGVDVRSGISFTVQAGKALTIYTQGSTTIYTGNEQRRRKR